ncbi:response regulator [Thalassobius vesicularis]|uniref:histidine kinase n=1 Tax=Thalassobius vesicularis TaxID=1294297 RepID=A0A4S3M954_9RHOB|nr:PAS-domain containing protein [Thalassobius vesicularis]THD74105.1 response regulator [Thalassobius vesicularis]
MRDTEALTMAGLNLIQQALSIYDSKLNLVICNRRFQEMFELPEALVTPGASFADTIRFLSERGEYGPLADHDEVVAYRVEQALAFAPHYIERVRPNGQRISVEGNPLPQGGWVAVYTDITRMKQQEELLRTRSEEMTDKVLAYAEELATANRKLQSTIAALEETKRFVVEAEARTRLTTEMMPAHIAHVGRDRCYTFSNRRLSSVMPGRPVDIIGLNIGDALGESAYAAIRPHLDEAFAGKASAFEFNDEISSRRIRTSFTPDMTKDGKIAGVYIMSVDITQETQARSALQQTRRREMAAQLTSGMAHDFSNLLTIILGSQSRLQRMELPDAARELVNATLSAAHRGGSLLNRLADITGARDWNPQPASLSAVLADLRTLALPALPETIRFHLNNLMRDDMLMLDTGMLQDSLLNLILNARDACGGNGKITLTVTPVQGLWVEFAVMDTGPGFSEAAMAHALEPFFTTKGGEGSGLGLAMVYDMTKLAGGRVRLGNTEDGGGLVVLRLPLRLAAPAVAPGLVLLVEDSPDLRTGIREMLTDMGHTVIEAASAEEALLLNSELPEISRILSDITLAGDMTGVDFVQALPKGHPPCYLMTSLNPEDALFREAEDLAPVLRKPFSGKQLSTLFATTKTTQ